MKHKLIILLLSLPLGGCGLLHVPTSQKYPGPIKKVRVLDGETNTLLSNANVTFNVEKYENWFRIPAQLESNEDQTIPICDKTNTPVCLKTTRQSAGTFVFEEKTIRGSKTIWFPLPPVLGNEYYKEHRAYITIQSPGYSPLVFHYCPEVPPVVDTKYEAKSNNSSWAIFHQNGTLDVCVIPKRNKSKTDIPLD